MEILLASAIGLLTTAGLILMCQGRTFPVILGSTFMSHAVNLFLFACGHLVEGRPPLAGPDALAQTDPVPQALVLTAIVISFGMTGVVAALAVRSRDDDGHDGVGPGHAKGAE